MTTITVDALPAAIIERALGDRGNHAAAFVDALLLQAERDGGNRPFPFSTGGNVWGHPLTGQQHMHVQLENAERPDRPFAGRPQLCGTLSTAGTGAGVADRALDVHWIRIGGTGWLTATVDHDEPRLLVLPGIELPETVMQAAAGEPLSRLLDVRLFGTLDPVVERTDPWPAEHVNASLGKQVMVKDARPALGLTLVSCGDVVLSGSSGRLAA